MAAPRVRDHGTPGRYSKGPDKHGRPGKGCRCGPCREAHIQALAWRRRMIAYGRWEPYRDATGTRRRIQALVAAGWSQQKIADRLGADRSNMSKILQKDKVTTAMAVAVAEVYEKMWDQPPPEGTHEDKAAASRARNRAAQEGWPTAWAWDDDPGPHCIDDPAATPAPGWRRRVA